MWKLNKIDDLQLSPRILILLGFGEGYVPNFVTGLDVLQYGDFSVNLNNGAYMDDDFDYENQEIKIMYKSIELANIKTVKDFKRVYHILTGKLLENV